MNKILLSFFAVILPLVMLAQNPGLYDAAEGLSGAALKAELHNIIKNHTVVDYYDTKYVLAVSDQDPNNSSNIIEVYTGWSHDAADYGTGGDHLNREHVWSKSHGNFNEVYPMYSDIHNLKPADATVNMSRGNKDFDNGGEQHPEATGCYFTSDSWEPRDEVKGDVARIIFYMATRYEGDDGEIDLKVVDYLNTYPLPEFGKLSTLLEWNNQDPPDDFERNRNNVIEMHQHNRNPYIDNPEWINYIWNNETPSGVMFTSFTITPEFPQDENVLVSTKITGIGTSATVNLAWGTTYECTNLWSMNSENGFWTRSIPLQPEGTRVYLRVETVENGVANSSVTYSYVVSPKTISIAEIQGSGSESPYVDEQVTTHGVVTAHFGGSYFLQDGTDVRSGIFVYDGDNTAKVGDQLLITGEVVEYFDLTEIKNVTKCDVEATGVDLPNPIILGCGDMSEDYESMLVSVKNAECTLSDWQANDNLWVVSDDSGDLNIENNSTYSYENPQIGQDYNVKGVLNFSWNSWRIKIQSEDDVEIANAISESDFENLCSVSPNPATGYLSISLNNDNIAYKNITIFEVTGRSVYNKTISKNSSDNIFIPVEDWARGIYILQVQLEDNSLVWRQKIVVN